MALKKKKRERERAREREREKREVVVVMRPRPQPRQQKAPRCVCSHALRTSYNVTRKSSSRVHHEYQNKGVGAICVTRRERERERERERSGAASFVARAAADVTSSTSTETAEETAKLRQLRKKLPFPEELNALLDPFLCFESFVFPQAVCLERYTMSKKQLNVLVRKLAQSENSKVRRRAEGVVEWLESLEYPVDSWMYTETLRSYRRHEEQATKAYQLYERVVSRRRNRKKVRLTSHFYAETMLALSKGTREDAMKAEVIWEDMLRGDENSLSNYTLTAFLCACATSGGWQRALRAFHNDFFMFQMDERKRQVPDVIACTTLMKALKVGGQWERGEQLIRWMYESGIKPNAYTYSELLALLGDCNEWERVLGHYNEMLQSSSRENSRAGVPKPNMYIFSLTMNAVAQAGQHKVVREVLDEMIQRDIKPNAMVLVSLLSIYEKKHEGERALALFRYFQELGYPAKMNIYVYNVLLSALSKSEKVNRVQDVFEELCSKEEAIEPDRVTYETLITAHAHVGDFKKADEMFTEMCRRGFDPTDYAYAARIKAYAKNNLWRESVSILREVENTGMEPSVHVYNATIYACEIAKKWELALTLYSRMEEKGIKPNNVTKALLSKICDEGIESFEDKQRQAATLSAIVAAAGALAIRTGVF